MPVKEAPKQARAKERKTLILKSAETLLKNEGPNACTTTNIAREAAIPVGSIYRYFADKEEILTVLHRQAYNAVEKTVVNQLNTQKAGPSFDETLSVLLKVFWQTARSHPYFRVLTRWINSQKPLWEVTPDIDSSLGELVVKALDVTEIILPEQRRTAMLSVTVTTLSILIDHAIEEDDEARARAILHEIVELLGGYLT